MKTGILKKIKSLNWIPAPRPLTELSIISVLELLCYIGVFVLTILLYQRWTDVTERKIDIECESLHPSPGNIVSSSKGDTGYLYRDENNLGCKICIDIPFSKVDTIGYSGNYLLEIFEQSNKNNRLSSIYESRYFDQVLNPFIDVTDTLDCLNRWGHRLFYNKITTTFDNYRRWHLHNMRKDVEFVTSSTDTSLIAPVIHTHNRKNWNKFTYTYEVLLPELKGIELCHGEEHGVMSKPSWYDKYDVSQFYFKVNVKSRSVSNINLNFKIRGANNYTFIEEKPDSLVGQQLYYSFTNDSLKRDSDDFLINRTILIHVQSKELEILQQSRIFGVTALLSALITVFLAFLIIWICRLVYKRWNKKLVKKQEKLEIDNSDERVQNEENQEPTPQSDIMADSVTAEKSHSNKQSKPKKKKR